MKYDKKYSPEWATLSMIFSEAVYDSVYDKVSKDVEKAAKENKIPQDRADGILVGINLLYHNLMSNYRDFKKSVGGEEIKETIH